MSAEEKAPRTVVSQLKDVIENAHKLAALIAAALGLITFTSGNRLLSYVFIAIACASVDWFLWRAVRHKGLAAIAMSIITAASVAWIGVNGWRDWKGLLFPPAKPGEVLLVVAQFDKRGGPEIDATGRIVDRLRDEFARADIRNVRIERAPKIDGEDAARRVGQVHRAVSVIWGWYDAVGIAPRFTIVRKTERPIAGRLTEVAVDEPRAFGLYIRQTLPAEMSYMAIRTVGQLYYGDGRFDEALRAFDVAQANLETGAQAGPASEGLSTLYLYRGLAYAAKDDWDQALAAFSKAIDLDPKNASAYNNRGVAFRWKRELDQALADYTRAIELDPGYAEAYNSRGDAYYQKGNLEQAMADLTKAIQLKRELGLASYNRGVVYSQKGYLDEALADYTRAIALDPKNASAYNNRGNVRAIATGPSLTSTEPST